MVKMPLSLNTDPDPDSGIEDLVQPGSGGAGTPKRDEKRGIPVMGGAAVAFGILGIFTKGFIFVPLGVLCSLISLFLGQIPWAFIGFLLAVAGLLTSPVLLAALGIAWLMP